MPLRAQSPDDFDRATKICRANGHDMPPDDELTAKEFVHITDRAGVTREAEVEKTCKRCGRVSRFVYNVLPGPRFEPKEQTRTTYPKDRPYLLPKGYGRYSRAEARGALAVSLFPKAKWPKAR